MCLTNRIITKFSKIVKRFLVILDLKNAQNFSTNMTTINKINYYLSKIGKNGADLCAYIGVSNGVYSQWNTGRTSPRKNRLPLIAEFLGVTVEDLLPDADDTGEADAKENAPDPKIEGNAKIAAFIDGFTRLSPQQQDAVLAVIKGFQQGQA